MDYGLWIVMNLFRKRIWSVIGTIDLIYRLLYFGIQLS